MATYYVKNSGNDANTGLSYAQAWRTCAKVGSVSFVAGDIVSFECGSIWKEELSFIGAGSPANVITIDSYGTGNKPIITAEDEIPGWATSGNWTQNGNIWRITLSPNPPEIRRLWLSSVEVKKALSATVTNIEKFYYDTSTYILYVYSTSNPASAFSSITTGAIRQTAIRFYYSYITINGIDFQGGSNTSVRITNSNYLTFDDCNIGWRSDRCGIDANATIPGTTTSNCEVKNCTFDVNAPNFMYDYEDQSTLDCIRLTDGVDTWDIHNNTFKDWGHGALMIEGLTAGYTSSNILFYNNTVNCSKIYYGRGFGIVTNQNCGTGNKVYRNYFYSVTVNNQVGSTNAQVYYNIFDGANRSSEVAAKPWQTGGGIELSNPYSVDTTGTKIWNNTIVNTHDSGIILSPYGAGTYNVSGIDISNNIIVNCGQSTRSGGYLLYEYDQQLGANTFRNNLFYKSGVTDIIYYGHDASNDYPHTVSEFNAEDGNGGDVILGNIYGDPLFESSLVLKLTNGSPAIDAGIPLGLSTDYLGNLVLTPPDVGAYQYIGVTPPPSTTKPLKSNTGKGIKVNIANLLYYIS